MRNALKIGLVSALAISSAAPAFAQYPSQQAYPPPAQQQYPPPPPYQPPMQSQSQSQSQYERDQRTYRADQQDYADRTADYQAARRDYERRLAQYQAERDRYDQRYGPGSYVRVYGAAPSWDSAYWDHRRADMRDARDNSYGDPCHSRSNSNAVAGGIIGALAGAALGSGVAGRGDRTEGAVLGAVVGGVAGASIGAASRAKCDDDGYYFSYDETVPYRESRYDRYRRSGQYDYRYYTRKRCRLAAAPIEWDDRREVRYVRVCPDRSGRYRITG